MARILCSGGFTVVQGAMSWWSVSQDVSSVFTWGMLLVTVIGALPFIDHCATQLISGGGANAEDA
ncbi:MAG: hypothetical protein ACREJB_11350 [Planctomycetaceae bacterium]